MDIPKIHEGEYRFCLIMWEHEPVTAAELVKLCQEQLGWKRTTTYTVIKRLGEKGVLQNDNGTITSLVSKDAVQAYEIGELVEKTFEGLLLALLLTQIVAFPFAIIFGRLAKKYSAEKLITVCIVAYLGVAIFAIFLHYQWQFWVLAVWVGMFQGGVHGRERYSV